MATVNSIPVRQAPIAGQSFAQAMGQFNTAMTPQLAAASKLYNDEIERISNMRSVTPEQLMSVAGSGVPMSAALGFNNPTELMGMLPSEYQAMVAPKESPSQLLQKQLSLVDSVTGLPEKRKALQDAARFNAGNLVQTGLAGAQVGAHAQSALDSATNQAEGRVQEQTFRSQEARAHEQFLAGENEKKAKLSKWLARVSMSGGESGSLAKELYEYAKTNPVHTELDQKNVSTILAKGPKAFAKAPNVYADAQLQALNYGLTPLNEPTVITRVTDPGTLWDTKETSVFRKQQFVNPETKKTELWVTKKTDEGWKPVNKISRVIPNQLLTRGASGSASRPAGLTNLIED